MNGATSTALALSAQRTVDELEAEITTLAAHLNAATHRFLVLVAELDRREGWVGWGVRSCAHWLNWKCGIGLVAAREKVRVAHALETLPQIADAMRRGTLSYAKVRAVTRIATPQNERFLLTLAQNGTASHVETTVRHYRRGQRTGELQRDAVRHDRRSVRHYWDEDGCLVIEGRLPPEQGALVVKALEAAEQALRARKPLPNDSAESPASSLAVAAGGNPTRVAKVGQKNDSAESSALPKEAPSWGNRQADALALMAETLLAHGPAPLRSADKHLVHVHIDVTALCARDGQPAKGASALEDGPALPPETVRRLCCDGGLVTWLNDGKQRTLDVGRKTRAIPPAIRRALDKRDQGCRFPGCTNRRFVDAHHIEHWADGGETKMDNLVLLCGWHHRLVHEGGFRLGSVDSQLRIRRPDGRAIPAVPVVPALAQAGAAVLAQQNATGGLVLTARTAVPHWGGERPDFNYMLAVLDQRDGRPLRAQQDPAQDPCDADEDFEPAPQIACD